VPDRSVLVIRAAPNRHPFFSTRNGKELEQEGGGNLHDPIPIWLEGRRREIFIT
jgi:hypothetical protein